MLITLLIIVGGGFVFYRQYSGPADKQKFEQAQASIDALYADIVAKLGEPNNYESTQSCGRPNQKFEQGPLSCSVGIGFVYALSSEDNPISLFTKIDGVISLKNDIFRFNDASTVNDLAPPVIIKEYLSVKSGMKCRVKHAYSSPPDIHLELIEGGSGENPFYVGISCGSKAKSEYYPI